MVQKKAPRKTIPPDNETAVLLKSARRCPLCFHLDGDLREKQGQIAHLDGDPGNGAEDNLAFICLPHHSVFDSKTSQHKNYTIRELKALRNKLYQAIAEGKHLRGASIPAAAGLEADRKTLSGLTELMATSRSIDWLRNANFAGWSFDWGRLDGIEEFASRKGPEYEFIDRDLEKLRAAFFDRSRELLSLLAIETFPVGQRDRQAVPGEWEWEQPERFRKVVKEIHSAAERVCDSYDDLVRVARKKLLP